MTRLGVNLSFAVKRWVEPARWAEVVRRDLGLDLVQFSFDLIDPWWPEALRGPAAAQVRRACEQNDIELHSAFVGLASYTYSQLLHPEEEGRAAARLWFEQAIDLAAALGARGVGGPVGGMSVTDAADEATVARRYGGLIDAIAALAERAAARGLDAFYIEPTPLPREFPWTSDQALRMLRDLDGRTDVPVRWCLDWGHAIYRPLYGEAASARDWLEALGGTIGMVHLQQSDGSLDCHWPFTRPGIVDPAEVARDLHATGLDDVPAFLEVFYPFEYPDDAVLRETSESIAILKRTLG